MKRLILMGEIGAGKSTLIRNALGAEVAHAGGFVTRRITENGRLQGFDLAPARIWSEPNLPAQRFLDFSQGKRRDDAVFSCFGWARCCIRNMWNTTFGRKSPSTTSSSTAANSPMRCIRA